LILGGAVAIVAAPIGAIAGAINAHSDKEVIAADLSLRAALAEVKASEELRNRVIADARATTPYDVTTFSPVSGSEYDRSLVNGGFNTELEVAVSGYGLAIAGRIDPDATLFIDAEARLRHVANKLELYRRIWRYAGVPQNYFKVAAGNAALLRAEIRTGLDKLGTRIVSDLFVSIAPELKQGSASPGSVFTIEAPILQNASPAQAPLSTSPPAVAVPHSPAGAVTTSTGSASETPTMPAAVDVPFAVDLAGHSYEGVAKLEGGHISGQLEAFARPVSLSADLKGNALAARLTGGLNPGNGNWGGACSAEGTVSPAVGRVTIPMLANCPGYNPNVVLHLNLPASS
jgi:hypothetical protein